MENYNTTATKGSYHAQNDSNTYARLFHLDIRNFQQHKIDVALGILTIFIFYRLWKYKKSYLDLPYYGIPPGPFGSWKAGVDYIRNPNKYLMGGYRKYAPEGQPFVVSTFKRYIVCITDPAHIEEIRRVKDDELHFMAAVNELFGTRLSLCLDDKFNQHQIRMSRENLIQKLHSMMPDMHDEISLAWEDLANIGTDWKRVKLFGTLIGVIARTANRFLVGTPLCRNQEYLDLVFGYATAVGLATGIVDKAPWFLRRAVAWYTVHRHKYIERATKMFAPIYDERRKMEKKLGKERWQKEKPNDAIQWIMDQVSGSNEDTDHSITHKLFIFNFTSIFTTVATLHQLMYDLATYPEHIQPLREEIVSTLESFGQYNKQSLVAMKKLDSVFKESSRLNGIEPSKIHRLVMRDYTFKSGKVRFTLPKGTLMTVPSTATHTSEDIYGPDAAEWKGFRFSNSQGLDKVSEAKNMMVSTNSTFLTFGHGIHACPGRFFAVDEMKMFLIYLLLKYDMKFAPEWAGGKPPTDSVYGNKIAEMEFRKRDNWKEMEEKLDNWIGVNK